MFRFLVQSSCGEGRELQTNVTGVCGECSQCSGHTGFALAHGVCAFPSTLLRLQVALQGAGPESRAVPVFGYSTKAQARLGLRFMPSWSEQLGSQELDKRTLPGCSAPYPLRGPSLSFCMQVLCALYLCWGADLWLRPSRRMSTIHNLIKSLVRDWRLVCSLVGGAISGAEFAPFPSPLPPASSGGWAGLQPASSSLVLLSPLF